MTKVLSLGGSVIVPEEINVDFLKKFKSLITKLSKKEKYIIVCGGGRTCRKYQKAARLLSKPSESELDDIGIESTKLNAELVKVMFGKLSHEVVHVGTKNKVNFKRILIAAGDKQGSTSDYDTAMLAKLYKVKEIINISNIDYVYTKDPSKFNDAKPIKCISWREFIEIVGPKRVSGGNYPFDPVASDVARKGSIALKIVNGNNIKNLEDCLLGKAFKGTLVH